MIRKFNLTKVLCAVSVFTFLVSCTKSTDLYDQSAVEENQKKEQATKLDVAKAEYASNFEKKYGKINPNQTWDFTTGRRLGAATRGATSITTTKIDGLDFGISGNKTITKNSGIYNAINTVLPERKKQTGKPAVLVCPTSSFYIFPISTRGRFTYDLKVKVGNNEPIELFKKTWREFDIPYVNGMKPNSNVTIDMKGLYVEAPVGTPVDIFIDNVDSNKSGSQPSVGTANGHAIYVDVPSDVTLEVPAGVNLKSDAVIKYIGIEDCTKTSGEEATDNDFNDIVLAIVGNPDVPEEVIITEEKYTVTTNTVKRYMVEDLGSTDDFDFNDIVVDVIEEITEVYKVTIENGTRVSEAMSSRAAAQKAIIRAMGGTLDFTLKIGDTTWSKSGNGFNIGTMYNTKEIEESKVLAEFPVYGWSPERNNISVEVNEKSRGVYTITFPKAGTAPMIIAVDPTQSWMGERQSVPNTWFY
jgi:hypothetical protein